MRAPTLSNYIEEQFKPLYEEEEKDYLCRYNQNTNNYNDFWQSTPVLGDFVPCKDGVPLEKPKNHDTREEGMFGGAGMSMDDINDNKEWEQALGRTKWTGFEIKQQGVYWIKVGTKDMKDWISFIEGGTIGFGFEEAIESYEDLITANIPLEPTEGWGKELKL